MRGGGPTTSRLLARRCRSSPHARGWSLLRWCPAAAEQVFPACAGVVPPEHHRGQYHPGLPRMRGGGPLPRAATDPKIVSSPHARGWSDAGVDASLVDVVFPACAGVVPPRQIHHPLPRRLPRMRGGGPTPESMPPLSMWSSPHARGWSRLGKYITHYRDVFPACAGVVPKPRRHPPGHGGLPRMRGGGPLLSGTRYTLLKSSPHARGWSQSEKVALRDMCVFPACAGVVP